MYSSFSAKGDQKTTYHLRTFHDTLVFFDPLTKKLRHGHSQIVPHNCFFVFDFELGIFFIKIIVQTQVMYASRVSKDGLLSLVADVPEEGYVFEGVAISKLAARIGANYLCAASDGSVHAAASQWQAWETFFLSAVDLKPSSLSTDSSHAPDFFLLRSFGEDDAIARLQSNVLKNGLKVLGINCRLVNAELPQDLSPNGVCIFHYKELALMPLVSRLKKFGYKIFCFGSDLYACDLDLYVKLSEIVDVFLMPTNLHAQILRSIVPSAVFHLPEGVDDIAFPFDGNKVDTECNNSICWFGYPESFQKSFRYLKGSFFGSGGVCPSEFGIITNSKLPLVPGCRQRNFHTRSFYKETASFGYSFLSHFPFDGALNTYIKSPNKLITSIVRGMVPIFSETPSYKAIAQEYSLEPLMFQSPAELTDVLRRRDCLQDRKKFDIVGVGQSLQEQLSPAKIALRFLEFLAK